MNLAVFEIAFMLLPFVFSNALGIAVSIFTNFMLNDRWTWVDRYKTSLLKRMLSFYVVSLTAAAVQLGLSFVCYELFDIQRHLSLLTGIACASVINFVFNNICTFRNQRSPSPPNPQA